MKRKIIRVLVIVVLLVYGVGVILSFENFKNFNPISTCIGVMKILFTDEEYVTIQKYPYKVIIAKPNQTEKTANELLDEYMSKKGFYKADRLGSIISYTNGTEFENIHFSINTYYSLWEWK